MESPESLRGNKPQSEMIDHLSFRVQPYVALHVFKEHHPEMQDIDELNPLNNSTDIRRLAMEEWGVTGPDGQSPSIRFRELINDPGFLSKIDPMNPKTVIQAYDHELKKSTDSIH